MGHKYIISLSAILSLCSGWLKKIHLPRFWVTCSLGIGALCFLSSCTFYQTSYVNKNSQELKVLARTLVKKGRYKKASDVLKAMEEQYPNTPDSPTIQVWIAWCLMKAEEYEEAIGYLDTLILFYPGTPLYQKAMYYKMLCYQGQLSPAANDQENAYKALEICNTLCQQFPQSFYGKKCQQQKILLVDQLILHHMDQVYVSILLSDYVGALVMLTDMARAYSASVFYPEIVYRIFECQWALNMPRGVSDITLGLLKKLHNGKKWYAHGLSLQQDKSEILKNCPLLWQAFQRDQEKRIEAGVGKMQRAKTLEEQFSPSGVFPGYPADASAATDLPTSPLLGM